MAVNISGTLRGQDGNLVQESMRVGASQNMDDWTEVETANGQYTIAGLEPGGYYVRAEPVDPNSWLFRTYYSQVYNEDDAEYIWVWDQGIDRIDFIMISGGRFSGSITVEGDGQLPGDIAMIAVYDDPNSWFNTFFEFETEEASGYTSPVLFPGSYLVRFAPLPGDDHASVFYGGAISAAEAEWVTIEPRTVTENISAELPLGGQVTGLATFEGEPLPGTMAVALIVEGYSYSLVGMGGAGMDGNFALHGVPAGECYLQFIPPSDELCGQWFRHAYSLTDATPVMVRAGEVTANINVEFDRGAGLNGTILKPDNTPLGQYEGWIELLGSFDVFGSNTYIEMTEDGVWQTAGALPPGVYGIHVEDLADPMIATQYYNNALHSFEANWMFMGAGMNTPPLIIQLREGAMIHGMITLPGNMELAGVEVDLMDEYGDVRSNSVTNEEGSFEIGNINPGSYYLRATPGYNEDVPLTPANALATTYSGNVYLRTDADWFDVAAGSNQEINVTMGRGGIVHVTATGPEQRTYDMFEDGVGIIALAIDAEGNPIWDAASPSGDDGPPALAEDGADYVLPAGSYTVVGVPIFIGSGIENAPAVRRTFLGGGFDLQGAQRINVVAGQTVQSPLQMAESGHTISGTARTTDGKPASGVTAAIDANGDIVCAYMPSLTGFVSPDGAYQLPGLPNGTYRVMNFPTDDSYIVTTWYPSVADPGGHVEALEVPEGAGQAVINNANTGNINIIVQNGENYTGVEEHPLFTLPAEFALHGAFPNPFNSSAVLLYSLNKAVDVKLTLTDVLGREVAVLGEGRQAAGIHSVRINGESLANGIYFARMEAAGFSAVTKITMMK